MADAPKLKGSENIGESYYKINMGIDNANEALRKSNEAKTEATDVKSIANEAKNIATQSNELSESVQTQLNTIVVGGDSSVEAAQARVDLEGIVYPSLKPRIDAEQLKLANISRVVTEISINIKTLGVKGDGVTDDTTAIENAFRDYPYKIIYFPDGNYRVTRPIRISTDNSLELSKNARVFADAAIDYIFDFNTSRKINSIYDLSKDCFIIGGTLDSNGMAKDILRLNKFMHFTLYDVEFKNGVNRGLVVNDTGGMAAELIATNLHFINEMTPSDLANCTAIVNLGTDNHYSDIITINWSVGFYDKGNAVASKIHYWISRPEFIEHSIGFKLESNTNITQSFADTARVSFKVLGGSPRISFSTVYYNDFVYNPEYAALFPPVVLEVVPQSQVLFIGNRILGNVSGGTRFTDIISTNINSVNNFFTGTVENKFSSNWDATRTSGFFLYNGNNEKGIIGTTSTKVFFKNSASGKQIDLNDDGTIRYDGVNLLGSAGTFTPIVAGSSTAGNHNYTSQKGKYYRNGNVVTCNITISGFLDGTIGGGLLIKGLPFEMGADNVAGVSFGYVRGLKYPVGYVNVGVSKDITIRSLDTNGNAISIDTTTLRNSQFEYHMSFSYPV
ncbi:glycosyl hydrolase family 28-related protein [Bacillus wiedmannii]|uniref:glycosyl hydrolase family 28-related protein n=3 Tax=Bacillus cereus group TaxID=86661 RepID=UPI002E22EECD|nr:glycosyl hydrolase family 28-related protein [Bacillus wiedmannii]